MLGFNIDAFFSGSFILGNLNQNPALLQIEATRPRKFNHMDRRFCSLSGINMSDSHSLHETKLVVPHKMICEDRRISSFFKRFLLGMLSKGIPIVSL